MTTTARPPALSRRHFTRHLVRQGRYAAAVVAGSLALGASGYHWIAGLGWVDALLNTSMLLAGMGPVNELHSTAAKLFAAAFALYSGIVFLVIAALMLTPVFHRVLHKYHWETRDR